MFRKFPSLLVVAGGKLKNQRLTAVPQRCMSRAYEAHSESISEPIPPFVAGSAPADQSRHATDQRLGGREHPEKGDDQLQEPLPDFAVLGVRKSVRVALHEAFPNIRTPTACQTEFIPAVLSPRDVILRDWTGTGK